jgi:hypothetical protein
VGIEGALVDFMLKGGESRVGERKGSGFYDRVIHYHD